MRAISPNTGAPEQVFAENQTEYLPLSVATYYHADDPTRPDVATSRSLVTAWVPTSEELGELARDLMQRLGSVQLVLSEGHAKTLLAGMFKSRPIFVRQLNFGDAMTPIMVAVGPEPWMLPNEQQINDGSNGWRGEDGG